MAEMNPLGRWMVNRRTLGRARRVIARLGENLRIPSAGSVLELGSGGGGLVALLHERFHPARLVGTDFDPAQVAATTGFLTRRWGSLPSTVEIRPANALQLPFPDGSFDYVFAMMMLHHVEEQFREYARRPKALEEVRRVLRPGGVLVYSEIFRRADIRRSLSDLGFTTEFLRSGWRSDLGVFRKAN
jgi:O-methyltransferase StaMB